MSYPRELDEYSDEEILKEARRRFACKRKHECPYCRKRLDSGTPCKLHAHTTPVPPDFTQEIVLQEIAAEIDSRLPSRRGFVLVVARFGEDGVDAEANALVSYVASISRETVPALLRKTIAYLEGRAAPIAVPDPTPNPTP